MIDIQVVTLGFPYFHTFPHPVCQWHQTEWSEIIYLGAGYISPWQRGQRFLLPVLNPFLVNGTVACTGALPTFLLLGSLFTLPSLKWKNHYSLCSGQQGGKWKKESRLVRNALIRQGVGQELLHLGVNMTVGDAGTGCSMLVWRGCQKCELCPAPPYCLPLQLFWFPFRIKA